MPGESSGDLSDLRARLNQIYPGGEAEWLPLLQSVFDRWGALSGTTYVYEPNDDGAQLGFSGALGIRGDVRIFGHPLDGDAGVLAYNYFPDNGDMVIDTADDFLDVTTGGSRGFFNMLTHEHGHGLGISHVCPVEETKLMEPYASYAFDGPQHDDIRAVQRLYGDIDEDNDSQATAVNLGTLASGGIVREPISIRDNTDLDYYQVALGSLADVTVSVEPIGFSYLSGPQSGSCTTGSPIDSSSIQDLALQIVDTTAATATQDVDVVGAGATESVTFTPLSTGPFVVRIAGDGTNEVQLYRLVIASDNVAPVAVAIAPIKANSGTTVNLTGDGSYDPDDSPSPLSYTWSQLSGPGASISSGSSANALATLAGAGDYVFQLVVDDGNLTDTTTVTVRVNAIPVVTITSPADGTDFAAPASFSIVASATDDSGVAYVEIELDGVILVRDYSAPYGASVTGLAEGVYTVQAFARDNDGSFGNSSLHTITVTGDQPRLVGESDLAVETATLFQYQPTVTGLSSAAQPWWELLERPSGMSINPSTGLISWIATGVGQHIPVTVRVSAGLNTDEQAMHLLVSPSPVPIAVGMR